MPRPRRLPPWLRLLGGLAVGTVLVAVIGFAWLAYSLNGGLPLPHTDPDDPRVDAAHDLWRPVWDARHEEMLSELETAGLQLLAVNETDTCHEGETNWKRRDPYGLECTLTWQVIVGAPAGDPTGTVTAVHEMAQARGEASASTDHASTFLSNLRHVEEDSRQVASVTYTGSMTVDGDSRSTRLEAYARREAKDDYLGDQVIYTWGDAVRSRTGPSAAEMVTIERDWVGEQAPIQDARWLVRLTDTVSYFAR